jgi:hypothetical protein
MSSPLPSPAKSSAARSRGKAWRSLLVVVGVLVLASGAVLGSSLVRDGGASGATALTSAEIPDEDAPLSALFREYFVQPVQLQHRTFTRDRSEPVVTGLGYLDLSEGCRFDITYTGALYQVEMYSDGRQLFTRNTKRETGSQSLWEVSMPLTSNLNSPVLAMAGNPTLLHCNLLSLARTLRTDGETLRIDPEAFVSLLAAQRQQEIGALLVLADAGADEGNALLATSSVDASSFLALVEQVTIDRDDRGTLRITVLGDGGRVLDELTMRHTPSAVFRTPEPLEQRTDLQSQARRFLGIDPR